MKLKIQDILEFLYSLDSMLLAGYVFLLKESNLILPTFIKEMIIKRIPVKVLEVYLNYKIYFLGLFYLIILIILSFLLIELTKRNGSSYKIVLGSVTEIENANEAFLPSYLGYFFVALSINSVQLFFSIFMVIFIFIYKSKLSHFNPIFLLLGYKYYYYTLDGTKNLLITKKKIKRPKDLEISRVVRLNDFTFIELEK